MSVKSLAKNAQDFRIKSLTELFAEELKIRQAKKIDKLIKKPDFLILNHLRILTGHRLPCRNQAAKQSWPILGLLIASKTY